MQLFAKNKRQSAALLGLAVGGLLLVHATQPVTSQAAISSKVASATSTHVRQPAAVFVTVGPGLTGCLLGPGSYISPNTVGPVCFSCLAAGRTDSKTPSAYAVNAID